MDTNKPPPRYAPKSEWSTLPIQPPAGAWQRRTTRLFPVLLTTVILFVLVALTTNGGSALFSILGTGLALELAFVLVAGTRGTQLERRERKLGYSTWARKR